MISFGVLLVILGVGSLVLPSLGIQFRLMELLDAYQPWAGIIVAAVGLITILFGAQRRGREGAPAAVATAQTAPSSPTSPPAEVAEPPREAAPAESYGSTESRDHPNEP
jgi:hypothetical protein